MAAKLEEEVSERLKNRKKSFIELSVQSEIADNCSMPYELSEERTFAHLREACSEVLYMTSALNDVVEPLSLLRSLKDAREIALNAIKVAVHGLD